MRRTLLVGGLLTCVTTIGVSAFAPGCAGGGADSGGFSSPEDGGGNKTVDGSVNLGADGSQSSSGGGIFSEDGPSTEDVANLQTCVHDTDCTSPNMCVGNNGVECAGGFCVPTGKPMDCDDGVPCTTDTCDANTNACVHTPNDSACPNDEYCDPTKNCVGSLPCTPGDSVCDRLDVSCSGLWTCDTTKLVCVEGQAPCPSRANAATTCGTTPVEAGAPVEAGTGDVVCSWTCSSGYVDVDGDLDAPVLSNADGNSGSDGCECHLVENFDGSPAYDPPDLGFVDANCDGIDGTISAAVFVDKLAAAGGTGTMAAPVQTITQGISLAKSSGKTDVYVSYGVYAEQVNMVEGVRIFGGYSAAKKWQRSLTDPNYEVDLYPNATTAVVVSGLLQPTEIQLFTIASLAATGQNGSGDGLSSIGVFVLGSTGGVTIRGCTITAANGANGLNGQDGTTGGPGGPGGNASGTSNGGPGSGCYANTSGGAGGTSVNGTTQGGPGSPGLASTLTGAGGFAGGGSGGGAGQCGTTESAPGGPGNPPGNNGGNGASGQNGAAAQANFGSFDAFGNYVPPFGANAGLGGTGLPGGGGGGGGAGGGTAGGTDDGFGGYPFCTDCTGVTSGGGGGGGGGGCGGTPGTGGRGGGASFGVLSVSSNVTVDTATVETGTGGTGGTGGNGGGGGSGGAYGAGGGGNADGDCGHETAGGGAHGSAGGNGGQGGGGAGGAGGPSICVATQGGTTTIVGALHCTNTGFGAGGQGGSNGQANATSGPNGKTGPQN